MGNETNVNVTLCSYMSVVTRVTGSLLLLSMQCLFFALKHPAARLW